MTADLDITTYRPPGPVSSSFLQDRANWVRGIMGPFGSGKTNACIFDAVTCAYQMPKAKDGNRYFRGIVLRDNYTNLWKTTIPSWLAWFPKDMHAQWTGSDGRQVNAKLIFDMPDGGECHLEMWFLALQDDNIENVLRGIEFTWGWINEGDLVTPSALTYMLGRVLQKRFPRKMDLPEGADYYVGIVIDYNPPDMDNWLFELFEEERPEGHKIYKQPSGRSPNGENRQAIPRKIYEDMARANAHRPDWVKRMVDGEYGYARDGEPVYIDYVDSMHCAEDPLKPLNDLPVRLGFDQGIRGPCMLVGQYLPTGQLRVLHEFAPGRMAPTEFGRRCKVILETEFSGFDIVSAVCDPAGKQGSDSENGYLSWFETVQEKIGLPIGLAETNEVEIRVDGVAQLLRFDVGPNQPALLISPQCRMLRKGFNSHYRYKKRKNGNHTTIEPKPEKNEYADPHDALQYMVMDLMGLDAVISGALTGSGRRFGSAEESEASGTVMAGTDFDVFGA